MSKTRIAVRVFLVLVLLGCCYTAYRVWQMSTPDYYWGRAQAAMAAGQYDRAVPYLRNLLKQSEEHGPGHAALAKAILETSRAAGGPSSYVTNTEALAHLEAAAKLLPDDIQLQKTLLRTYVQRGQLDLATPLARAVFESAPKNTDALFLLAHDAAKEGDHAEAVEWTAAGLSQSTAYAFETLAIQAAAYEALDDAEQLQETLATTCRVAASLTPEQLERTAGKNHRVVIPELLGKAVFTAADVDTAQERAEQAVTYLTHLHESGAVAPQISAVQAARLVTALEQRFPPGQWTEPQRRRGARLSERIDALLEDCLAKDVSEASKRSKTARDFYLVAAQQSLRKNRLDDAEKAIDVLLEDKETTGWGRLLAGRLASERGQFERALREFLRARDLLGSRLQVRQSLAATYYRLQRWEDALEILATLHVPESEMDADQKRWTDESIGSESSIHLMEMVANLQLEQWSEAIAHFERIKGTDGEREAAAHLIAYMWSHDQKADAKALLGEAREKYADDQTLARIEARIHLLEGDAEAADAVMEQIATDRPDDLATQTAWCQWLIEREKHEAALRQLQKIEPKLAATEAGRKVLLLLRSKSLAGLGRVGEAADVARELLEDPQFAAYASGLALAAADGDPVKVDAALREAARLHPDDPLIAFNRGGLAAYQGDYDAALDQFAQLLDTTAVSAESEVAAAVTLLKMANEKGAETALAEVETLLQQSPDHVVLGIAKAEFLLRLGSGDESLALLTDLQRQFPDNAGVSRVKAELLIKRNRTDEALGELERAARQEPTHAGHALAAARLAASTGRYDRAAALLDRLLARDATNMQAGLAKASVLAAQMQWQEAANLLERLQTAHPEAADVYRALAEVHDAAGDHDSALEVLRRGIAATAGDHRLLLAEIRILAAAGQLHEAKQIAESLAAARPDADTLLRIGEAMVLADRLEETTEWWTRALETAEPPAQPRIHEMLGDLMLQLHNRAPDATRLAEAIGHYEAVLTAQPENVLAANNLAWILAVDLDQPARALPIVEQAFADTPAGALRPNVVHTAAFVYRKNGKLSEARTVLEQALASQPDRPRLLFELGQVCLATGDLLRARSALERALEIGLSDQEAAEARALLETIDADSLGRLRMSLPVR